MSLEDVARTLTTLSQQPTASEFTIDEIVDANLFNNAPYPPHQIGKTPIDWYTGAELDADILREDLRRGKLRAPIDSQAPIRFPRFKSNEIILGPENKITHDDLYPPPYDAQIILLRTGHAAKITSRYDDDSNVVFDIETLLPGEGLILAPAQIRGLRMPNLDYERPIEYKDNRITNLDLLQVTDVLNNMLSRRSIVPQHTLQAIVTKNCLVINQGKRPVPKTFPVTQFDRVPFDPITGNPIGITQVDPASVPGDRHP